MSERDRNRLEWESQLQAAQGRRKGFRDFDTQFSAFIPKTRAPKLSLDDDRVLPACCRALTVSMRILIPYWPTAGSATFSLIPDPSITV